MVRPDSHNVIVPFTSTCEARFQSPAKQRVNRFLCTLLFFTKDGCEQVFEHSIDYENHQLQGYQLSSSNISVIDKVTNAFAARMVFSLNCILLMLQKSLASAGTQINEACFLQPWMNTL